MPTIRKMVLSDETFSEISRRAEEADRSVEEVAAELLRRAVENDSWPDLSKTQLLKRAKQTREGHPHAYVTEEFLRMAKDYGRL